MNSAGTAISVATDPANLDLLTDSTFCMSLWLEAEGKLAVVAENG
jgi:hypothetical protein